MSDVAGADLEQLDALASSSQQRGAEIAARAHDLNGRLVDAVTTFQGALTDLRTRASTANDALLDDVDELARIAASTTWTGANRQAFDGELGVLEQGIAANAQALTARIGQLEHMGVAPFAELMTAFGRQTSGSGDAAEEAGNAMRTRVAQQRRDLADAADLGWSAL